MRKILMICASLAFVGAVSHADDVQDSHEATMANPEVQGAKTTHKKVTDANGNAKTMKKQTVKKKDGSTEKTKTEESGAPTE